MHGLICAGKEEGPVEMERMRKRDAADRVEKREEGRGRRGAKGDVETGVRNGSLVVVSRRGRG